MNLTQTLRARPAFSSDAVSGSIKATVAHRPQQHKVRASSSVILTEIVRSTIIYAHEEDLRVGCYSCPRTYHRLGRFAGCLQSASF